MGLSGSTAWEGNKIVSGKKRPTICSKPVNVNDNYAPEMALAA